MAEQATPPLERPPDFRVTVTQAAAGLVDADIFVRGKDWLVSTLLEFLSKGLGVILKVGAWGGVQLAQSLANAEDQNQEAFGKLAAVAISDLFGVNVDPAAVNARGNRGGRAGVSDAIGDSLLKAFAAQAAPGVDGAIVPSDEPAKRFLSAMAQLALEGWLEGWIAEACTAGQLETFGELDDAMSHVLGLGRASAAVHGPLVKHMIVEPLEWQINKVHRPTLLGASTIARQLARGRGDSGLWLEHLARQGYSDVAIEALLNEADHHFSVADVDLMVESGYWDREQGIMHLRNAGLNTGGADIALHVEQLKRTESFERAMATAAVDAFASGRIDDAMLEDYTDGATMGDETRAQFRELAHAKHALRAEPLTSSEAKAAVKVGILAVADYRHALRREGRTEDAILALELLLRHELDDKKHVNELRAAADADRLAEQTKRRELAAAKQAELEQHRALARRGSVADLRRAVVRGIIPIARLEEVLRQELDADAVAILVADVEIDRLAYVDEQKRREDALRRAEQKGLGVGDVEQAVLENVLTLTQYRARLAQLGLAAADVDVLARTLEARKKDLDAARAQRDKAAKAAKTRSVSLATFEQLVRRGARTLAQYDALLSSLGFDDAARAAMKELLQLEIADAAKAAQVRSQARADDPNKGLSLELLRRGVILGVVTEDAFQRFLIDQNFSADAQIMLMAELRQAVTEADAARQRREQATTEPGGLRLPLATVARAARLGVVSPATYRARLVDNGYAPDDVEIEMQLVLTEIADVQAARARRDQAPPSGAPKGLSLSELARAVRLGVKHLEDYRARAVELGFSADDVETQVRVLGAELAQTQAAKVRRDEIAGQLTARSLSLVELEDQVKAGTLTVDGFIGALESDGYELVDAELLAALLVDELVAAGVLG